MVVTKRRWILALAGLAAVVTAIVVILQTGSQSASTPFDIKADWAVEKGFDISIDTEGYRFPTSIAFVPNPGNSPMSPLYFVTELRGKVKVVTNDRTVLTFAEDFFALRPKRVNPTIDQSVGMAGICLAPNHGYVFVTFAYHDADNIVRNNIVRFEASPGSYDLAPAAMVEFTEVFASYRSSPGHQIGACEVKNDRLYVSIGDAGDHLKSQRMETFHGKILRMTLDGRPAPDNPFYQDADIGKARNYIWASGLRNPFGMKIVGDKVFIVDNGPDVDRFLQVKEGGNYLWDGTNASIGTNADAVFYPGRGVAQMEHYPTETDLFPGQYSQSFFMTMTGNPEVRREGIPAIWSIPYDLSQDKVSAVASPVLRYRGQQVQIVSSLGFGPDGLYFAPMVPKNGSSSQVLKLRYAPEAGYPFTLQEELNPVVLMNTRGCLGCHSLNDGHGEGIGPNLGRNSLVPRLEERLNSEEYSRTLKELDELESEPFVSFHEARRAVSEAQGLEKIRLWLHYRILEPRFDDLNAEMPQLALSSPQAEAIAYFLSGATAESPTGVKTNRIFGRITNAVDKLESLVQSQLPVPTSANARKYLAAFFGIGAILGVLTATLTFWWFVRRQSRQRRRSSPLQEGSKR